ncbi:MAG: aminoglycoside phosphotransferase family protein [Succinivibrionaceae bacterium]
MNERFIKLELWYRQLYKNNIPISMISGDASNRKFYRCADGVLMDAPPKTEKNEIFIKLSSLLNNHNVKTPKVLNYDLEKGFILVSDLGNCTFEEKIKKSSQEIIDLYYTKAVLFLKNLVNVPTNELEVYDANFIIRENNICNEWYFDKVLNKKFSKKQKTVIENFNNLVIANSLKQPQIAMHRDYHCRNIMVLPNEELAVVDFQDMVKGPLTYDLVSLLKDCYYEMPQKLIEKLLNEAYLMYKELKIINNVSFDEFVKFFDLTGLQRHYKCLGIFNRLKLRDGKSRYQEYLPLVKKYIIQICEKYSELYDLGELIREDL